MPRDPTPLATGGVGTAGTVVVAVPSPGSTAGPKAPTVLGGSAPKPQKSCPAVRIVLDLPAEVALLP